MMQIVFNNEFIPTHSVKNLLNILKSLRPNQSDKCLLGMGMKSCHE